MFVFLVHSVAPPAISQAAAVDTFRYIVIIVIIIFIMIYSSMMSLIKLSDLQMPNFVGGPMSVNLYRLSVL